MNSSTWRSDRQFTVLHDNGREEIVLKFMPSNDHNSNFSLHHIMRENFENFIYSGNSALRAEISLEDLTETNNQIKSFIAPGEDETYKRLLVVCFSQIRDRLLWIYRTCFNLEYFLNRLITILKTPDKDSSNPKSLRSCTLLSELGKLLEDWSNKRCSWKHILYR